jgi:hypothetical protein
LRDEYMAGEWCTNREQTAQRNKDANFSALTNVSQQFWRFDAGGEWGISSSGWIFERHGSWRLAGRDELLLDRDGGDSKRYRALFENSGKDLVLQAEAGDFLVMTRCE